MTYTPVPGSIPGRDSVENLVFLTYFEIKATYAQCSLIYINIKYVFHVNLLFSDAWHVLVTVIREPQKTVRMMTLR